MPPGNGNEREEKQENACTVARCDTLRRNPRRCTREGSDVRPVRQTLVIWCGRGAEQGCRDGFGVCQERRVVDVEIDGRAHRCIGRLVEFVFGSDHLGGFARERGEVSVHGDDGGAKANVSAHRKDCREEPEGRGRG